MPSPEMSAAAPAPNLTFVGEARIDVDRPVDICRTIGGLRRFVAIRSGTVSGPAISGNVLPGGADWQIVADDGSVTVDATYALRLEDGVIVQVNNRGVRTGPPAVMAELLAGRAVDPDDYYFRTVPRFFAPAGRYEWMNRSLFVGSGARHADHLILTFWRVT